MYENLFDGLNILFSAQNAIYIFAGCLIGILLGGLPGFNASTAMVVLLPFTYLMDPAGGMILLVSVACAAIYGGSITAILFRTPGTIGNFVTVLDGYEMTKNGEGVRALGISVSASTIGGILSGLSLLIFAPPLAVLAASFSFPETFVLIVWTFTIIGVLSKSVVKGLAAGALGMLLASVGADPVQAFERMTFGIPDLFEGITFIVAIMGFFCFSQMMTVSMQDFILHDTGSYQGGYKEAFSGAAFPFKRPGILGRSSLVGILVGALPAAGTAIATMLSYAVQKNVARNPESYGTGNPEGVLASETSNNATEGSCMIPMLTLGIPGSNIAAVLMAALTLHGIVVGPRIFEQHGDVVYSLIFAIILANPLMFIIGIALSRHLGRMTVLPIDRLGPYILVFILFGTYAVGNSTFHFQIMVAFGVLAYFMQRHGYPIMALALPFVLGQNLEQSFLIAMRYSDNDPSIFFKSPICTALWGLTAVTLLLPKIFKRWRIEV